MSNARQQNTEDELEINLNDIIGFFATYWKFFAMGIIFGFVTGLVGTRLLFSKYEAEAIISNESVGISYSVWAELKRELPILAFQISASEKNSESFFNVLSSGEWWKKNITPTFGVTKENIKDVLSMPKEMQDGESIAIKSFVLKVGGKSEEDVHAKLSKVSSFIRSGSSYLALKKLIRNYQTTFDLSVPQIERDLIASKKQLEYLNRHMGNLELLKARFPKDAVNLPVDLKNPGVKYLPLTTQIVALNDDIQEEKEKWTRLRDKLNQNTIIARFLTPASIVIDKNLDGLSAIAELEEIESGLRKGTSRSDSNDIEILNDITYSLKKIRVAFPPELAEPNLISISKPYHAKYIVIGLTSGFLLALLGSFFSAIWLRYRRNIAVTGNATFIRPTTQPAAPTPSNMLPPES